MRRADRLFSIIQHLRRRKRATTARELAEKLEVSERTIYRDVRDLVASGTPIDGEAGVGYVLSRDYDLPPLMFDAEEVEALILGARLAMQAGDPRLSEAAGRVLSKVIAVLPRAQREVAIGTHLYPVRRAEPENAWLDLLRQAMRARRKVRLTYADQAQRSTERVIRPLGAFHWGRTWTLTAYCELRRDFRSFRIDRVAGAELMTEAFIDEPGKTLRDFLLTVGGEALLDT